VLTDAWPADSKTDAWPADPEDAVLTPGGGRGAGVRSGAGGGEGGTDVGALDSFPILIVRPQSTAGWEAAQYSHSPLARLVRLDAGAVVAPGPGHWSCGVVGRESKDHYLISYQLCTTSDIHQRLRYLLDKIPLIL